MVKTNNCSSFKALERQRLRILAQKVWNDKNKTGCILSITFVPIAQIVELNTSYFNKNQPTDIISFTLGDTPDGKNIGDIYICPEIAEANAKRFNCSLQEELARLVIHGVLHFTGYEDSTKEEKSEMSRLEELYLDRFYRMPPAAK